MQDGLCWEQTMWEPGIDVKGCGYWPTPNASDNRDRGCMEDESVKRRLRIGKQIGLSTAVKETRQSGTLNPAWVEWLMGWPEEWTDLKPLEMDKFRQWLNKHGKY